jgi:hypothetical protein
VLASLATPLGTGMVDYLRAYDEHIAPNRLPFEWQATHAHAPALALVLAFALLAGVLWHRAARPRPPAPALAAAAFTVLALSATRHVVWLGPLAFYLLHELGHPSERRLPLRVSAPCAAAGVLLVVAWWALAGPASNGPPQLAAAARHAIAHPPPRGRLLAPSGTGSYVLWRDPGRPVTIDGRLELYGASEVIANYSLLKGEGGLAYLRRWRVGGVLTPSRRGARALERHGFRLVSRRGGGYYLLRRTGSTDRARARRRAPAMVTGPPRRGRLGAPGAPIDLANGR